jgi:2-keto-3-deoxy-L-fuconate dehydrogenase
MREKRCICGKIARLQRTLPLEHNMTPSRLKGKSILVTAAGQGIGRAIAIACREAGAEVLATDVVEEKLADLNDHGLRTRKIDVLDGDEISHLSKELNNLDVIINCAGYVHQGTILDCSEEDWEFSFQLNVKSIYLVTKYFIPKMIERRTGNFINIASVAGSIKGIANRFAYGATKAAVIGMTKSIAADFVKYGIRANAICPGTVDTPSLSERIKSLGDEVEARKNFVARQPMGRLGRAEEVAAMAVYLASDESDFVTGQTMIIDGGITI